MADLLPPSAFGLPKKFDQWRKNQDDAVCSIISNEKRYITQVCPTGFGKSLNYVAAAVLKGGRSVLITSTKGLQTQLLKDFESVGAVDIRGAGLPQDLDPGDVVRGESVECSAERTLWHRRAVQHEEGLLVRDAPPQGARASDPEAVAPVRQTSKPGTRPISMSPTRATRASASVGMNVVTAPIVCWEPGAGASGPARPHPVITATASTQIIPVFIVNDSAQQDEAQDKGGVW